MGLAHELVFGTTTACYGLPCLSQITKKNADPAGIMLSAHLKAIPKLDRLPLRGPSGAHDEFLWRLPPRTYDEWLRGCTRLEQKCQTWRSEATKRDVHIGKRNAESDRSACRFRARKSTSPSSRFITESTDRSRSPPLNRTDAIDPADSRRTTGQSSNSRKQP